MRVKQSEYMHWAKTCQSAPYKLATSGVADYPLADLAMAAEESFPPRPYGYPPLLDRIAAKHGVDQDCVVTAQGTSGANHLALAAMFGPGDDVLIESPTYELLFSTAKFLGARVNRFKRRAEDGFAIDPEEVQRAMTPRTKLIVITNLHNPSSALVPDETLREIGDLGCRVLVDEVYLDAVYENTPRSAVHLGPQFIVTNSLTKVYGLSSLRCGWILAEPSLAWSMWRLNDLFGVNAARPAELFSVTAFDNLAAIRQKARDVVEADRVALSAFLDAEKQVSAPRTGWGTTAFVRLRNGDVEQFAARLRSEFETSIVPGRFFDTPDRFRIGMGQDSAMFAEGLRRISRALHSR